jgi:hypothetical protein
MAMQTQTHSKKKEHAEFLEQSLELFEKGIISKEEFMSYVKDPSGNLTFPGINRMHMPNADPLDLRPFVLKLFDKQLLEREEVRQFFGFGTPKARVP